jgi:hypothetical protein
MDDGAALAVARQPLHLLLANTSAAMTQRATALATLRDSRCRRPRSNLTHCIPLASPGTGSLSLVTALERLVIDAQVNGSTTRPIVPMGHYHSLRIAPSHRASGHFGPEGWYIDAPCYLLSVREPAARLQSGFTLHHEKTQARLVEYVSNHNIGNPCGLNDRVNFASSCARSLSECTLPQPACLELSASNCRASAVNPPVQPS